MPCFAPKAQLGPHLPDGDETNLYLVCAEAGRKEGVKYTPLASLTTRGYYSMRLPCTSAVAQGLLDAMLWIVA